MLGVASGIPAIASCGDYLHTKNSQPAVQDQKETEQPEQNSQTPCHGKGCQRQEDPAAPPVPAPSSPTPPAPDEAVPSERLTARCGDCVGGVVAECGQTRRGFPVRVDRPPRSTEVYTV